MTAGRVSIGIILLALAIAGSWVAYSRLAVPAYQRPLPEFSAESRPADNRYLFDYAGILVHYEEGAQRYLERIGERFGIEALVVSVADPGDAATIETLAADLLNGWKVGAGHRGRGLLLLLSAKEKAVKLEVSYELEDVFTDAFTGYIEDLQLRPYFLDDNIGTGLIAVMEEIERRARIKNQHEVDLKLIAKLDAELLSGGAGAKRDLTRYRQQEKKAAVALVPGVTSGAATADEAWRTMLAKWAGRGAHIDTDVYTELTRMAMGDPDNPEARVRKSVDDWLGTDYEVLEDGTHAVIWFGNREGWNFAPFLFCRTAAGWKFDIVHQRRLVVMADNPHWKVMQGDYPYVDLLGGAKQSTGKDIPLPAADRYSCERDSDIARQIVDLENRYRRMPDDFDTVMQLARLNVLTGRRANHVMPLLEKAKQLAPASAEPYRYAAIYQVNSFLQYRTALQETQGLLQRSRDDLFGHNLQGFLHYRLGDYRESLESLQRVIEIEPRNVYALVLMARDYTLLYQKSNRLDPRRDGYRESALQMLQRAENAGGGGDSARVARLRSWMKAWKI